jgi:DNA-binding NarL/FixJ family response regulator
MVIALVADLFFSARIRETARLLEEECEIVRDPAALPAAVRTAAVAGKAKMVIVDMNVRTGDPAAAVRTLKTAPETQKVKIVGYLHDKDEAAIKAARAAGCDKVMSRGGLTRKLPELCAGDFAALQED